VFRTHVGGQLLPGAGRNFVCGICAQPLRNKHYMNKHTRRLSAAVTAAASAAVLATLLAAPANAADTYKVKAGDTLSAISGSTGVPLSTLFSANSLGWNTIIYPGQTINLGGAAPAATPAAPASGSSTYTVKAWDTLSAIAGRTGVSLHTLFSLNNLGWNSIIYPGQVIKTSASQAPAPAAPAPQPAAAPAPAPAPAPAAPAAQTYTVKSGDSLWAISSRTVFCPTENGMVTSALPMAVRSTLTGESCQDARVAFIVESFDNARMVSWLFRVLRSCSQGD
jgi:LysM repeat protein